jgi:hypothetical protein
MERQGMAKFFWNLPVPILMTTMQVCEQNDLRLMKAEHFYKTGVMEGME